MSEEIDLTELPQKPTLKEKRALCLVLEALNVGGMENFQVGFTIQKVDEKTLRFIRVMDHPVAEHFVNLFIETGEELGIKMEVNPYIIMTPIDEDSDDDTEPEQIIEDTGNMFVWAHNTPYFSTLFSRFIDGRPVRRTH